MTTYLNRYVKEVCDALVRERSGRGYAWPVEDKSAGGCFEDVVFRDVRILRAVPPATFCCGVTFEILWKAWRAAGYEPTFSLADARALQRDWFNARTTRTGPHALARYGLGEIVRPEDATPGDFAQLWRQGGGGHSVVVLERHEDGRLTYLSTQPSTNGIGKRTERDFAELYVCRAIVPGAAP